MESYNIVVPAAFGLEKILYYELRDLGMQNARVDDGAVYLQATAFDIFRMNLWLRAGNRVWIELASFEATDFDMLFDGVASVPWGDILPEDARIDVTGKSHKSVLHSVPACQSITKKSIIEKLKKKYSRDQFDEDGSRYHIEVAIVKNRVSLRLDSSGEGLHRRGYRTESGEAPLRETVAASLVQISRWDSTRPFIDPCCGSGTIPIEAAMYAANMAPGLNRRFDAEGWPFFDTTHARKARDEARQALDDTGKWKIQASDKDPAVIKVAQSNAERAGVSHRIEFTVADIKEVTSHAKYGCVICNPPYGSRIGDEESLVRLYREMKALYERLPSWSWFVLTGASGFEEHFGHRSQKHRKLYNGKIRTYLYQFLGELPPR